MLLDI
ncbi:hypothetical protein VCCP104417_1456, partial [Vibrio cholerae CP1044(17)]